MQSDESPSTTGNAGSPTGTMVSQTPYRLWLTHYHHLMFLVAFSFYLYVPRMSKQKKNYIDNGSTFFLNCHKYDMNKIVLKEERVTHNIL